MSTRNNHLAAAAESLSDAAKHVRLSAQTYVSNTPGRTHLEFVAAVVSQAQRAVERLLKGDS